MTQIIETVYPKYCIVTCDKDCIEGLYHYGFIFCLIFTVLTTLIALYNVIMHFINFNNPYFQSKIIIIVLMGPIYCVTSTLSFISLVPSTLSKNTTAYITLARDFYQAFALMGFVYLIYSYLAYDHDKNQLNERKVYEVMINSCSQVPHNYPCSYFQKPYQLSNWLKAKFFSHRCKRAILQFIICKIVTTAFLALVYPNYELRPRQSSDWDYIAYQHANTVIYWILTISCYIAYYYMSLLYSCLQKPLQPFKPDLKFTTFNTVVFFTYWQKVWMVIFQNDILGCFDQQAPEYHIRKIMYAIEHILICLEMFVMIIAAAEAYSFENYRLRTVRNFGSLKYIIVDILTIFINQLRLFKPKTFGFTAQGQKRETQLLTITNSAKRASQNMGCSVNIQRSLLQNLKQNYF